MKPSHVLFLICLGALALRLGALTFVQHPGVADPNHYYNLGVRIVEGHDFTSDYIWFYVPPPEQIDHPETHWMPLTAWLAAAGMRLFGVSVPAADLPFALIGALLPLIGYWAACQFGVGTVGSLFAAAAVGALPEFVLNSARTDTTIPNAALVCVSLLALTHGLRGGRWTAYLLSGAAAGLAYLTRNDSLLVLPAALLTTVIYALWGRGGETRRTALRRLAPAILVPVTALIVVTPWLIRTTNLTGSPTTPQARQMVYYTRLLDLYNYEREFSLETMLADQTPAQLIGKRLFELAAAFKLMYTTLDLFLPVAVFGGLALILIARDRRRMFTLAPALILLVGFVIAYPLLTPFHSQGGSFKKAYLTLIPLLVPLAGYALERAIPDRRMQIGTAAAALVLMSANGIELTRSDTRNAAAYMAQIQRVADTANALPDTNGDGEIVLMAQDPFMLRFVGMRSVQIPAEPREVVLEVAARYGVDYLLMPPDRPALDALASGGETDPRFTLAGEVEGTAYRFYRLGASQP
ncbi:MAG: glycosyltransferase family 39 protein [Anaerolineae bacterium]|nr:glycosyltransferase family 39 protein [Anaerolineae bacterium]